MENNCNWKVINYNVKDYFFYKNYVNILVYKSLYVFK